MKKRLLSLALAVVMVLALLPTAAMAVTVTEIVPCKYDEVRDFSEGLAAVCVGDYLTGKWGFIDKTGKEVVPCKYEVEVGDFDQGLATVGIGMEYSIPMLGLIDKTGKEVAPCKYAHVSAFNQGLAAVNLYGGNYCGFIDTTGKEVVPCTLEYFWISEPHDGLAVVRGSGGSTSYLYGFVDTTGKEIVPPKYDSVSNFSEGLAAVELDDKYGFVDATGKEIVSPKYDRVGDFSDGLAAVWLKDKGWGFIDTTGKEVVPCKYDWADSFSEGLAAVKVDTSEKNRWNDTIYKYGFIDKMGQEVVPCQYNEVGNFSEGLAAVRLKGKGWGFIDAIGKEAVPCKYENDRAPEFHEGLAAVMLNGKWGFIDKTGKEVVPCKYGYPRYDYTGHYGPAFREGLAVVELDGKYGFIDKTGKEVVPCKYNWAESFSEGLAAVQLDGKWGFLAIDNSGDTPAASTTAYASTQTVTVDGKPVTFYAYALKDANGNDTNYIKLRDVAQILNGSAAQFQVGYDGSITITTKTAYTPNGSEMVQNFTGNQSYTVSTSPVTVNGQPTNLEAITLTDASGGGYTYFKLRDLGAALGFNVTWNAQTGISIDPNSPYNANN